ncbi:NUDIX domain-containing protein [Haliovirga abyssi]|uniref:Nudix hydrolase domain-containing protein n=1 Tax=Haliovirga abyssi TaxID=2996794 RepID=A0AAU9D9C6_9FUSO|nr:NUDIX hydrolase [Haliovirga abyssi]BDU50196.1 hypothetical protein HLVA_07650 [Haliovirga abyssi]
MKEPRVRVAGILTDENGAILFVKHKKKVKEYWLLPGGGVDYGETFQESLKREFIEETNLEIEVENMVMIFESIDPKLSRHIINIIFVVKRVGGKLKVGDEEILKEVKFIKREDINDILLYPNIKEELIKNSYNKETEIKYLKNRWE